MADPRFPVLSKAPDRDKFKELHRTDQTVSDSAEGGGYNFTRTLATRRPRAWEIGHSQMPDADHDLMVDFVDNVVFGEAVIFTWTHPLTGKEYSVRFKKGGGIPSYNYEAYSDPVLGNLWTFAYQIEEA